MGHGPLMLKSQDVVTEGYTIWKKDCYKLGGYKGLSVALINPNGIRG